MSLVVNHNIKSSYRPQIWKRQDHMLKRFCEDAFNNSYLATIGIDFKMHTVEIAGQVIMIISAKFLSLMMLIWFWVLAETLVKIIMLNCFWRITHDHYIFRRWSFRFGTQLAKSGFTPSPLASTGTEFSPPQSQTALFKQIIWKCICKKYFFIQAGYGYHAGLRHHKPEKLHQCDKLAEEHWPACLWGCCEDPRWE